ncbi:MAG: hypothetical protein ACOH18_04755 [Candidatus Saccharimonadaceae bacterium]
MVTTEPTAHDSDLLDLAAEPDELKGRIIFIQEEGRVSVGVISDIFVDGNLLVVAVEQQVFYAKDRWTTDPVATTYHGVDGDASTITDSDGSISIYVPLNWTGKILPPEGPYPLEVFDI